MHTHLNSNNLPIVLVGPVVRRVDAHSATLWLITSIDVPLTLNIALLEQDYRAGFGHSVQRTVAIGKNAFVQLITFTSDTEFTPAVAYKYDIVERENTSHSLLSELKDIHYNELPLHFFWQPSLTNVLHGSCRKPHYDGPDALAALDKVFQDSLNNASPRPDLLVMTGDQVYTDDVAGPMLQAIHQISDLLGLYHETLEGCVITCSDELPAHPASFYDREALLPKVENNKTLLDTFFGAKEKPVFTSVHAKNHLITLNEMLAMYVLVWSPACWPFVHLDAQKIAPEHRDAFNKETQAINEFVKGLSAVQRVLAHIPVYMIFDDHDITDDWNLTRDWEEIVYGHPLSKRVIGNAIAAYWLCQGWGNEADKFAPIYEQAKTVFKPKLSTLDTFIDQLYEWSDWHYQLPTSPTLYVLDTRTQRWRSESNGNKPSGLMDWEALCEFQHGIIGHERVIVVSAAPIYGVKLIEAIQKTFTFFGQALTVDAENWMAHRGTANVMLNIFRHIKTPPQFIILSGDVHYSFVYDVSLKFRRNSPKITQFTCSGMKNVFPDKLLATFDSINQILYSSRSPLNWFTKRRQMKIKTRRPENVSGRTLINTCAVGQLLISPNKENVECQILKADGSKIIFEDNENED